jgi:hypothetical protein
MAGERNEVKAVSVLIVLKTDRHAIKLQRKSTPGVSSKTPGGHQKSHSLKYSITGSALTRHKNTFLRSTRGLHCAVAIGAKRHPGGH